MARRFSELPTITRRKFVQGAAAVTAGTLGAGALASCSPKTTEKTSEATTADDAEAFNLLLKASGGTSYEQLPDSIAETEKENTLAFFELCKPFVNKPENISGSIAAQASTFIVKTVFDCLLSGKSESEAIREAQLASEFCLAGLKQIWGI